MSRESEVATRLRADATLVALVPGGIYTVGDLGEAGITDPKTTPNAWLGGRLRPTVIVRARAPVPSFGLVNLRDGLASASQMLEVYAYARQNHGVLTQVQDRIYTLLQGYALDAAWPTVWTGSLGPLPAPELGDADMSRSEYQIVTIRRPAPA